VYAAAAEAARFTLPEGFTAELSSRRANWSSGPGCSPTSGGWPRSEAIRRRVAPSSPVAVSPATSRAADLRIPALDIAQAGFTGISIMPEGLLEAMTPEDVADLFAYLQTLTAGPPSR
jgi:hypothetical protein